MNCIAVGGISPWIALTLALLLMCTGGIIGFIGCAYSVTVQAVRAEGESWMDSIERAVAAFSCTRCSWRGLAPDVKRDPLECFNHAACPECHARAVWVA